MSENEKRPIGKSLDCIPEDKIFEGMKVEHGSSARSPGKVITVNECKNGTKQFVLQENDSKQLFLEGHNGLYNWYFAE